MEDIGYGAKNQKPLILKSQSKRKLLFGVFGFVVLISVASIFVIPQVWGLLVLKLKFPESKYPGLYTAMVARDVGKFQGATGTPYTYLGMTFALSWGSPITINDRTSDLGIVHLDFPDNKVMTLGGSRSGASNLLQDFLSGQSQAAIAKEKALFGDRGLSSDYEFYKALLSTNLNDVSIFSDNHAVVRESYLSVLKFTMMIGMATLVPNDKIYSFRTPYVEGIQWGDPAINGKGSYIDVFDLRGGNHHWLSVEGTQNEIDAILNSLELASSTES